MTNHNFSRHSWRSTTSTTTNMIVRQTHKHVAIYSNNIKYIHIRQSNKEMETGGLRGEAPLLPQPPPQRRRGPGEQGVRREAEGPGEHVYMYM